MALTQKQRKENWRQEDKDRRIEFLRRLAKVQTPDDLRRLSLELVGEGMPGRLAYTNLSFFLSTLRFPNNSTTSERVAYVELARKMNTNGEVSDENLRALEQLDPQEGAKLW